ncbi:enoyl-CoA hydratase/isomerase family protein [Aldersonia sp. NBC_00410]|uniref:enoyl-CoA hydratase/isomerase family protein n=1 Tax=Aldersonia sp. NBC_00410 TaxID=2975954 RepID=UPI0022542E57|nr:enoyl-CoA hydratase/isomerase family protein [Aldersonia sp. NBC_00410]MCX5045380.1 enoyl-CoA hydratase/isomerase family protein [Aldersonia sp. NBC_00410]
MNGTFETILLDVDAADHVATITLNRPERLNAFDRTMCEEMARAWHAVKFDEAVHAVVIRAAGERAFSAGLDIKSSYGQPDNVWNHEDPGELLSPKWQKMWKPVVCAVQGICTAGAFYFVNEADVVICSTDATFFDSHVSAGLVSALEPIGLMRRIGLGETLRMALLGNDERVGADTALRIGLVTEVVARPDLWSRAHQIAATIAAKPPSATQGTVKAIWESLDKPYRAAMEQGLIYTRVGNPLGTAELAAQPNGSATDPRRATTPRIR